MRAIQTLLVSLVSAMAPMAMAAQGSGSPVVGSGTPELIQDMAKLPPTEIERQLPAAHPADYYVYANQLWAAGNKDKAVFWFYAGQLRYRFHLLANPGADPSGDPALFASLQDTIGRPINLYAGSDLKKWIQEIDAVLAWDEATANGFTSKANHKSELQKARGGLAELRDYLATHGDEIRKQREQQGVGNVGVANGTYVEEHNEKMPEDWPALAPQSSPAKIAGIYVESFDAYLGPILFFEDQHKVLGATSFELSVATPATLIVIARKGDQEVLRRAIPIREENGAFVFEEHRAAEQVGLSEGGARETVYLRVNSAGELVIQRESLTEGKYKNKPIPIRLSYTFWNRAKRLAAK
jgi:hypothetical protein